MTRRLRALAGGCFLSPGAPPGDSPGFPRTPSSVSPPSDESLWAGALPLLLSSLAQSGCPKGTRPVSPGAMASVLRVRH